MKVTWVALCIVGAQLTCARRHTAMSEGFGKVFTAPDPKGPAAVRRYLELKSSQQPLFTSKLNVGLGQENPTPTPSPEQVQEEKVAETLLHRDLRESTINSTINEDGSLTLEVTLPPPSDCPDPLAHGMGEVANSVGLGPEYVPIGENKPYDPDSPLRLMDGTPTPTPVPQNISRPAPTPTPQPRKNQITCEAWGPFMEASGLSHNQHHPFVQGKFTLSIKGLVEGDIDTEDVRLALFEGLVSHIRSNGGVLTYHAFDILDSHVMDESLELDFQIIIPYPEAAGVVLGIQAIQSKDIQAAINSVFSASRTTQQISNLNFVRPLVLRGIDAMEVVMIVSIGGITPAKPFSPACECAAAAAAAKSVDSRLDQAEVKHIGYSKVNGNALLEFNMTCVSAESCHRIAVLLDQHVRATTVLMDEIAVSAVETMYKCHRRLATLRQETIPQLALTLGPILDDLTIRSNGPSPWTGLKHLGPSGKQLMTSELTRKYEIFFAPNSYVMGCPLCAGYEYGLRETDSGSLRRNGFEMMCRDEESCWIGIDFGTSHVVTRFAISSLGGRGPSGKWFLQASHDKESWITVGTAFRQQWGAKYAELNASTYPFEDYQIASVGFPGYYRYYRIYGGDLVDATDVNAPPRLRIANIGLWGSQQMLVAPCSSDWVLVGEEEPFKYGGLAELGEYNYAWSPGTVVRLEWGKGANWDKWAEFVPHSNPFMHRDRPARHPPLFGNRAIKVTDVATNDPVLEAWIKDASFDMDAVFCIANSGAWETAWALKDISDRYYGDMGCNRHNWDGKGLFYGLGRKGCFAGVQDHRQPKTCNDFIGVRILIKCAEALADPPLLTNQTSAELSASSNRLISGGCIECLKTSHERRFKQSAENFAELSKEYSLDLNLTGTFTGNKTGPYLTISVPEPHIATKFALSTNLTSGVQWDLYGRASDTSWFHIGSAWDWQVQSPELSYPFLPRQLAAADPGQAYTEFRLVPTGELEPVRIFNLQLFAHPKNRVNPIVARRAPYSTCLQSSGLMSQFPYPTTSVQFDGEGLETRRLKFTKFNSTSTDIRIEWHDHFTISGNGLFVWTLKIDKKDCVNVAAKGPEGSQEAANVMFFNGPGKIDRFGTSVIYYCTNVSAGVHEISVQKTPTVANGKVGLPPDGEYPLTQGMMTVTEVPVLSEASTQRDEGFHTRHGIRYETETDRELVQPHMLGFIKSGAESLLRVTWSDNFVCAGLERTACQWEVLIDGESCRSPGPMVLQMDSDEYQVNYRALTFAGYCSGIKEGNHTLTIRESAVRGEEAAHVDVKAKLGLGGVNFFTIEVMELNGTCYTTASNALETGLGFQSSSRRLVFQGEPSTHVHVRWYDNFACSQTPGTARGGQIRCNFELRIDGQDCLQHDIITDFGYQQHQPSVISGECILSDWTMIHEVTVHESVLQGLSGGRDVEGSLGWKTTTAMIEVWQMPENPTTIQQTR